MRGRRLASVCVIGLLVTLLSPSAARAIGPAQRHLPRPPGQRRPSQVNGVFRVNVEGVLVVSGTPTSATRWIEGTAVVTVTDGRLTVSNGTGAGDNKVNYLDIDRPG